MPHELINEQVDIFKLPAIDESHKGNAEIQVTIGDLHGNAMKLMFMLVKHGIATQINDTNYERLVAIYITATENLTKNHLEEFNQILSKMKFRQDTLVRLIGDELADRGSNDYYTLKILEKLNQHKVPVEIIVSNHSIEFIEACEKQNNFHAPMLRNGHALSMEQLQDLVDKGIVARQEILTIAKNSYKPTLRAISYSLSQEKQEITIYSHAGIGLGTIKSLAQKLQVEYKDNTASELAQTIDNINVMFQIHVQTNRVNTLYTRDKMEEGYGGDSSLVDETPLEFIMWNRNYTDIHRPASYFKYRVNFVHGHDDADKTVNNIYNLDNNLGKFDSNEGTYTVLYSKGEMVLAIRPEELAVINIFLQKIQAKEQVLRKNGHTGAADCAQVLYETVETQLKELTEKKDISNFKQNCTQAIEIARPELEKHRGWKQVLGNLALAVVGVGVLYVIAGLINKAVTGNFLFFKTDSSNKIDQLEQLISPSQKNHK